MAVKKKGATSKKTTSKKTTSKKTTSKKTTSKKKTTKKVADKPAGQSASNDAEQGAPEGPIDYGVSDDAPLEAPPLGKFKSPVDAALYEGPKVKLEGHFGIPEVDAAVAQGIDPSSQPDLMARIDAHYSDEDLLKMVEDGTIKVTPIEEVETPFSEDNFKKFVMGEITWGQLQGLTMEEAYAFAELGYTQFEQGRYDEAQSIFEGLVISNPYDAYFHTMLGAIYARKDMQEEAAEEYTIAIELDQENISAFVNRAEILLQHGEFEIAMADLKNAIRLDPKGEDPSGIRARALAAATAAIIEEILEQRMAEGDTEAKMAE